MIAFVLTTLLTAWTPQGVVRDYIKENYPWSEVEVQPLSEFKAEGTGVAAIQPDRIVLVSGKLPGRATFQLKFPSGQTIDYAVNVEAFDWVVSARRPLKKGEIIGEGDVYRMQVNVKTIPIGAITEESNCIGRTVNRSIPVNRTITENAIETVYTIKKGQEVTLFYESGNVRITAKGIARDHGNVGEAIKVENPSSKKIVVGTVIDSHTVRVER
ncbi:MAG: flagellar basal body P-ring formation protein FlgA [Nitrospirae bacterium]|nr:flagellar basal body P-ring formation protein FlgA [Nitrospirota bacterium]